MDFKGTFKIHELSNLILPETKIISMEDHLKENPIKKTIEYPANSLVQQFLQVIMGHMAGNGASISYKDTGNTGRTFAFNQSFAMSDSPTTGGVNIVVGTGNTAVAVTDYALVTKVAHGTGAGQLYYCDVPVAGSCIPIVVGASSAQFSLLRPISNVSGGSITITEIGFYAKTNTGSYIIMLERTVLASSYALSDKTSVMIEYIIKVSI